MYKIWVGITPTPQNNNVYPERRAMGYMALAIYIMLSFIFKEKDTKQKR